MKKLWYILILLCATMPLLSKQRMRRSGNIANALQSPHPTHSSNIQLAAIDKLSDTFKTELREEGPVQKGKIDILNQTSREIPTEQHDYQLPTELQKITEQKAQDALLQVEQKEEEEEKIELQFEDADLQNFVHQIATLFNITFISDEALDPLPAGTSNAPVKAIKGNKITFKTNRPLSRKEAWDLFITFLDIAGFSVVPQSDPTIYRIQTTKSAQRAPVPTYIGVNYETLPDNDQLIRYLYFVENAQLSAIQEVVKSLTSTSSGQPIFLLEHKAFILTDKSYNIKSLMAIIKELDKVTMPQAMSVLKMKEVDAADVKKLYEELTQTGDKKPFQPFGSRKQSTAIYFPENARLIVEPRTNSLILLGPRDAIQKIEEFVSRYIDVELDQSYSALHTYQLKYADAKAIAEIMNKTTQFGQNTAAGQSGGVRGQDKFLRQMVFTPEPATNKLIIKGDYEDFLLAEKILIELDKPRPQVALEVLILSVELRDEKALGAQIRSKVNSLGIPALSDLLGKNTVFQTSGLGGQGIVTNPSGDGFTRLLGNLLSLVTNSPAGNTVVTFGQDIYGVWGLFKALRTLTNLQVVSNPFVVASSKTPAKISIGETRRVVDSTVFAQQDQQSFGDQRADLIVNITPQINSDGKILLNLEITVAEFTNPDVPTDPASGNKTERTIKTQAVLSDKEVLALGGLIREQVGETLSKTPILAEIPLLGWLFKNRSKSQSKSSILVLMSTSIIKAAETKEVNAFTQKQMTKFEESMHTDDGSQKMDPIYRLFFADSGDDEKVEDFIFERQKRNKRRKRKERQQEQGYKQSENLELTHSKKPALDHTSVVPAAITALPTMPLAAKIAPKIEPSLLPDKKRRSRSLSSFLSQGNTEETV